MNTSAVQRPLGPPTGGIGTVESHGNKCEIKWIIPQFPFRFKYFPYMVSPRFEWLGIHWQFVMYTNLRADPERNAILGLLLRGSTLTASASSAPRTIAYKMTLLDKYDSPRKVRCAEEQFTGSTFHVALEILEITDILDDCDASECDVFSFQLEMMIKAAPSEL